MAKMPRDLQAEPILPIADIQGDILVGLLKNHEHLIFFRISDVPNFKAFLKELEVTSTQECLDKRAAIAANKANHVETIIPTPGLNVAFTYAGLQELGAPIPASVEKPTKENPDPGINTFHAGMAASSETLQDPDPHRWAILRPGQDLKPNPALHGVFIVTGSSHAEVVDVISLRLVPAATNGWIMVHEEVGQVRPEPVRGHEHFGYADGVSQPGVRGRLDANTPFMPQLGEDENQGQPGQDLLWPGEFLFGHEEQKFPAADFAEIGPVKAPPAPFMANGAFMVFRKLAQKVPEFNASVKQAAAAIPAEPDKPSATLLGAQLVGRWKSGAPLELTPTHDDPAFAEGTVRANDFEFGEDREGLKCPWAAHVRKAYPRDDVRHNLTPTPPEIGSSEAFTQTHRMLRRGIAFGSEVTEEEALQGQTNGHDARGLLFISYITSLEDQFEFVQRAWCNTVDFSQQPISGIDAIIGQTPAGTARPFLGAAPFTGVAANKPLIANLSLFVELRGGAYFFAPSIPAIKAF
jgi:Dyp-type peroxidase family